MKQVYKLRKMKTSSSGMLNTIYHHVSYLLERVCVSVYQQSTICKFNVKEATILKSGSNLQKKLIYLLQWKPLKMMKTAFYFIFKAFFVLKIFKFLSCLFGNVEKQLDWKYKVIFKIYDITTRLTNSCHTHIAHYITK